MTGTSLTTTAQTFLTNKEKSAGALFTTVAAVVGFIGLWTFKAAILSMIGFGIKLVGGVIALGIGAVIAIWFLMLLMNPKTWTEIYHLQARTASWVSTWAMNPIVGTPRLAVVAGMVAVR